MDRLINEGLPKGEPSLFMRRAGDRRAPILRNKSVKKIKKFEKSFVKRLTNSRNYDII